MSIEVLLFDGDTPYNVSHRVGNVTRSDNLDGLGQEIAFDYLYNRRDKYTTDMLTEPGDHVQYLDGAEIVVEGLIVETTDPMQGTVSVTGYDYGYWLNETTTDIQFNGCTTSQAIEELMKKVELNVSCVEIPETVTHNYYDEAISDILKSLIGMATHQSGNKYRLEVRGDTVYIEDYEDLVIEPKFVSAANIAPVDVVYNPGHITITRSIADMYNHVVVKVDGEIVSEAKDDDSIAKFGDKTYTIDDDPEADAEVILKDVNKVVTGGEVDLLGDNQIRSGRILEFTEDNVPDFVGKFIITNCEHSYTLEGHTVHVTLVDAETRDASVEAVDPNADAETETTEDATSGDYVEGDGIGTGQYTWPLPGAWCNMTTYPGHTNNARDFPVSYGTGVVASDGGYVDWVQYWDGYTKWGNQSYGNCVRIQHGNGRYTLYAHLSRINVVSGQSVSKGQSIGAVGSTGNSTGPHLHMEIVHNGWGIDPATVY